MFGRSFGKSFIRERVTYTHNLTLVVVVIVNFTDHIVEFNEAIHNDFTTFNNPRENRTTEEEDISHTHSQLSIGRKRERERGRDCSHPGHINQPGVVLRQDSMWYGGMCVQRFAGLLLENVFVDTSLNQCKSVLFLIYYFCFYAGLAANTLH